MNMYLYDNKINKMLDQNITILESNMLLSISKNI
jgi:hypothetical protein